MNTLYLHLVSAVQENYPWAIENGTIRQRLSLVVLTLLFGDRYDMQLELQKLTQRNSFLEHENKMYSKKLTAALKQYAKLAPGV